MSRDDCKRTCPCAPCKTILPPRVISSPCAIWQLWNYCRLLNRESSEKSERISVIILLDLRALKARIKFVVHIMRFACFRVPWEIRLSTHTWRTKGDLTTCGLSIANVNWRYFSDCISTFFGLFIWVQKRHGIAIIACMTNRRLSMGYHVSGIYKIHIVRLRVYGKFRAVRHSHS